MIIIIVAVVIIIIITDDDDDNDDGDDEKIVLKQKPQQIISFVYINNLIPCILKQLLEVLIRFDHCYKEGTIYNLINYLLH